MVFVWVMLILAPPNRTTLSTNRTQAWAAHEEQARVGAEKLLAVDEVIYTRILQRDWAAPPELATLLLLPGAEEGEGEGVGAMESGAVGGGEEGSVEQGVWVHVCWFGLG